MSPAKPPDASSSAADAASRTSPALLFQNACLVLGSYRQAERWFTVSHPLLDTTPRSAQSSPVLAGRLGALIEALSKGWPA